MAAVETGSRAARTLENLYRLHAGQVYRYAYAMLGNHADAEDVAQTTFVNALRALERGERPREAGNWLLVIARNIIRQRFRQQRARPPEVELERDVADRQGSNDDDEPTLDELVRALQRIPPAQREAIVMRELEGRSYKEIAGILEVSTGALETLLFRARRSLAEELENLVTCEKAEQAMSKLADGRLSRKDRRRLAEHLAECASCAHIAARQRKHRRSFKGLAVLPLPLSLTFFKGAPTASAAATLPVVGTGAAVTGGAVGGAGAGGAVAGGFLASAAAKAAAVVAAAAVAGGVGYETVTQLQDQSGSTPAKPAVGAANRTTSGELSRPVQASAETPKSRSAADRGKATRPVRALPPTASKMRGTMPGASKQASKNQAAATTRGRHHSKLPPGTKGRSATAPGRQGVVGGPESKAKRSESRATPKSKAVVTPPKTQDRPRPSRNGVAKSKAKGQPKGSAKGQAKAGAEGAAKDEGGTTSVAPAVGTDEAQGVTEATAPGASATDTPGNGNK